MKVRIVEAPLVSREFEPELRVGAVLDTVGEPELKLYSRERYPSEPREGNLIRNGSQSYVRLVNVTVRGRTMRLFQHEYEEWKPLPAPAGASDDEGQRARVSDRIEAALLEFARRHIGKQFHAEMIRKHVRERCGEVAPGSPDRILRDMRKREVLAYRVVSRAESLYEITSVA